MDTAHVNSNPLQVPSEPVNHGEPVNQNFPPISDFE